jgi:hypothetical protein
MKTPSLYQQLLYLRANMPKLSNWEKGFVREMLEGRHGQGGLSGLGSDPSNTLVMEYTTDKQVDTIRRLYEQTKEKSG